MTPLDTVRRAAEQVEINPCPCICKPCQNAPALARLVLAMLDLHEQNRGDLEMHWPKTTRAIQRCAEEIGSAGEPR